MTNQESHYKILQVKASADKTAIVDAIAILRIKQRDNAAALARCEASFLVLNDEIARDSYDKQLKEDVVNEDIRSENMTRNAFILLSLFNWFLPKQGLINATPPRYQGLLLLCGLVGFGIIHIAFIFQILFHGFVSLANTLRYMPRNYLIATIYATVVIVAWLGLFSVATRLDEPEHEPELHNESTPAAWEWYVTQLPFATIFMDSTQTAPFNVASVIPVTDYREKTIGFLFLALTKKNRVFWSAYTALGSAFALLHSSLRSKFKNSANSALVPESKLELAGLEMFTEADPQQYNFCFITEYTIYIMFITGLQFFLINFFFGTGYLVYFIFFYKKKWLKYLLEL